MLEEVFDRFDDLQDSNDDETCVRIPVLGERGAFEAIGGSPYIMVRMERSKMGRNQHTNHYIPLIPSYLNFRPGVVEDYE